MLVAGTAALAAPAAAQASAALPGPSVVPCSSSALVAAIQQANAARFATVVLSRNCSYVLTSAAAAGDGLPPVTGNVIVTGSGGTTISRAATAAGFRIFAVAPGGRLTLANVTVANGSGAGIGGGILDQGTLALRNVRLTGNTAGTAGGLGLGPGAQATLSFSQLTGNSATSAVGGGIQNAGQLSVDHSTLSGNTAAAFGGGLSTEAAGTSRITRTAVAHNHANVLGGGIANFGTTVLTGDRVVFNSAGAGGGISSAPNGSVSLRFTLVAFNSPDNCSPRGTIRGCRH